MEQTAAVINSLHNLNQSHRNISNEKGDEFWDFWKMGFNRIGMFRFDDLELLTVYRILEACEKGERGEVCKQSAILEMDREVCILISKVGHRLTNEWNDIKKVYIEKQVKIEKLIMMQSDYNTGRNAPKAANKKRTA